MVKKAKRLLVLLLCFAFVFSFAACKQTGDETSKDATSNTTTVKPDVPDNRRDASERTGNNASQPLVISTMTLDGKFNPFYYTSGYDGDIVGMTQIPLITSNEKAEPVAGINENSLAYSFKMTVSEDKSKSTYEFILKNGITFSDGTPVSSKDVLFNLYEFLDPAYTGSSTLFSMNIVGYQSYKNQVPGDEAAEAKDQEFGEAALKRVEALVAGNGTEADIAAAWAKVKERIAEDASVLAGYLAQGYTLEAFGIGKNWPEDFNKDAAILGYMGNISCEDGTVKAVDTNVDLNKLASMTLEEAVDLAFNYTKANMSLVEYDLNYGWSVVTDGSEEKASEASDMFKEFKKDEATKYLEENKGTVKSISGITADKVVCDDGVERERITVVLNGVDPKAIWNFTFYVAPLHYYSTDELVAKFDGVENFGVEFNSTEFQDQLKKKTVPLGAGPYIAADDQGNVTTDFTKFFKDGIVNFVANDNFMLSAPKIKYVRYKTISAGSQLSALKSGEVMYSDPPARPESISELAGTDLKQILVDNLGYGYIGINAKLIPDINARRAIASAFDVTLALEYYTGGLASNIYRSMSKISWAYPTDATNMYPFDESGEASKQFFLKSDNFIEKDGKVVNKDGSPVKYTFTLPQAADDHPAGRIFLKAKEVLAKIGVDVTIEVDDNLLSKLENDVVAIWAAAWQATIDPDLFQVYYSDPNKNTSSSPKSYGLYWLFENGTDEEKALLRELNDLIMKGRESLNVEERKPVYAQALDDLAKLCVEIPTYQRKNMYVYNSAIIDGTTLWQNVTPYKGPLAEIWNVSFK